MGMFSCLKILLIYLLGIPEEHGMCQSSKDCFHTGANIKEETVAIQLYDTKSNGDFVFQSTLYHGVVTVPAHQPAG